MRGLWVVAGYALREALRRRVFAVVLVLTLGYLALYAFGVDRAFRETGGLRHQVEQAGLESDTLTGATLFGLSLFATLFLGVILTIFLTHGVVSGDAERGLLQPLVVRPLGRATLLVARFLAAVTTSAVYIALVYGAGLVVTGAIGGWWPDRIVTPALQLAAAIAIVAVISILGSVFLSSTANGIAVFMVFGAGLTAGLLGQVGEAIGSGTLEDIARVTSWILPFEALYQDALSSLTADTAGLTRLAVDLGPFGGAQSAGPALWVWAAVYTAIIGSVAIVGFERKDL